MKRLRLQLLIVVLALVSIGVLLFVQQTPTVPGNEPVIEPLQGGVYTEAIIGHFGRLNPLLDHYNQADRDIDRLIFSGLVKFDHRGLPYGDLAQDWAISRDGESYTFAIRADAVWHDGEPVTSYDVIFTIELMRADEMPLPADIQDFWSQVNVDYLDDKTLTFQLPEPFAPFLDYLTFGILPEHLLVDLSPEELMDASFNLQPVGSGPYRFDGFIADEGLVQGVLLKAFKDYYGQKPYIDEVVFRYYSEAPSAFFAYKEGDVVGISDVTSSILPDVLNEPALNLYTGRLPRLNLIYLNLDLPEKPFLQEAEVRRALLMGINRRWIVDRLLGGQAILANGPIFPESWAYYEGMKGIDFDPDAAIQILKEAGYTIPAEGGRVRQKEGVRLSFELVFPDIELYGEIAAVIQSNWERLGVQALITAVPYEQMLEDYLEPHTYDAALVEIDLSRLPDPDPYPFWHQAQITNGQNYAGWDDRQASEYLERARVIVEFDERARLYRNFQVRFLQEVPALMLFYPVHSFSVDKQIQGISVGPFYDPSDRFLNINSWFLFTGISTPQP
ncbi:peptide ABC transporter substrate-binding protein [Chloroflexota bacterium]